MASSDLNDPFLQALFRVDPTEGLVQYVNSVKPYHTKVLDVLVEYVFAENVNVTIIENLCWQFGSQTDPPGPWTNADLGTYVQSCGWGILWDPTPIVLAPALNILTANTSTNVFTIDAETSATYDFEVTDLSLNEMTFTVPPPNWRAGFAVKVQPTLGSTLPSLLSDIETYYFIPSVTIGTFRLSKKRFPTRTTDYVEITSYGIGNFEIYKAETLYPGAAIEITGTAGGLNDGNYTVYSVVPSGLSTVDVTVMEKIPTSSAGGTVQYRSSGSGFDSQDACFAAQASGLRTDAFIRERLDMNTIRLDYTIPGFEDTDFDIGGYGGDGIAVPFVVPVGFYPPPTIGPTPPLTPVEGDLWINSVDMPGEYQVGMFQWVTGRPNNPGRTYTQADVGGTFSDWEFVQSVTPV